MIPRAGERKSRRAESGYALLLIFLMAAVVAALLYMELPRVAFEAQRNREELLIERGEQYKRAIQLYFRKLKSYPPSLEALENTNNVRFLRRRYSDPLTGKDEWRLIHVGPGGIFTDSLTRKPKTNQPQQQANVNTFITEGPAIGSTQANAQPGAAGPPRRPSEGGQPQPGADSNGVAAVPGQPGADQPPADPNNPLPTGSGQPPAPPAAPPGMPQSPVSAFPGFPSTPYTPGGQPQNYPTPGMQPPQTGTAPPDGSQLGGTPLGQAGIDPTQAGAGQSAADLLNGLLTRPRPMPGTTGSLSGNGMGTGTGMGTGMGNGLQTGGIAGVASKVEKSSIKIYKDYQHYNEWEFIYDYAQDRTGAGRVAASMGGAAQQQGGQTPAGGTGFGASNGQMGSGAAFGGTPGFGGASAPSAFGGGTSPQPSSSSSSSSSSSGGGGVGAGMGVVIGAGLSGSSNSTPGSSPPGGQGQQPPPQAGPLPPPQSANPPH